MNKKIIIYYTRDKCVKISQHKHINNPING